jgi:phage terminase large subunit GpA-like protein
MTLSAQLDRSLRDVFAPVDTREVWQWAEDEIVLTRRQTETPGPYSTLLTPYIREPLECFSDARVTDLALCFGTQTSKTTCVMIGAAWRMCNNPFPTLWVMPTESMARSFSENRWQPMVQDCRPLNALKPYNTNRFKALEQQFRDATLTFVGSNSPSSLASRPAGLLVMDETDKFAEATEKESSAVALAENRTKSYTNALRVKTSTPTVPDGEIWSAFIAGDQRYFFVPCPHCEEKQRLEFSQVKWDKEAKTEGKWNEDAVRSSAYYECIACNKPITDGHKTRMLRGGEWRPTNTAASAGHRSYHLNSLYAPWRSCSFGELAVKFLRSKETPADLQDFNNSTLAIPYAPIDVNVREEKVRECRDPHCAWQEVPAHASGDNLAFLFLGADPGQNQTHWVVSAVSTAGEITPIDCGTVLSPEDLVAFVQEGNPARLTYKDATGREYNINRGLVDSGYLTERVYNVCYATAPVLWPSKGSDAAFGKDPVRYTRLQAPAGLGLYTYIDNDIKTEFYDWRIARRRAPLFRLPMNCPEPLIAGLSGQQLVTKRTAGGTSQQWKKLPNDHYGDCVKLACVGWQILKENFALGQGTETDATETP